MSLDTGLLGYGMASDGFVYQRLDQQSVITLRHVPQWPSGMGVCQGKLYPSLMSVTDLPAFKVIVRSFFCVPR